MKRPFLLTLLVLLSAVGLRAQEYRTRLSGPNPKIVIEMRDGEVTVDGHDGNEVIISGNGGYEAPD